MDEYKIGDRFRRKNTKDTVPLEIISKYYEPHEIVYELKPILGCGNKIMYGQEGLEELFYKLR